MSNMRTRRDTGSANNYVPPPSPKATNSLLYRSTSHHTLDLGLMGNSTQDHSRNVAERVERQRSVTPQPDQRYREKDEEDERKPLLPHLKKSNLVYSLVYLTALSILFAVVYVVYLEYLDYSLSTCETGDRESCMRRFEDGCTPTRFEGTWWSSLDPVPPSNRLSSVAVRLASKGTSEVFYQLDKPYSAVSYDLCFDLTFETCSPQLALTYYTEAYIIIATVQDDLTYFPGIRNRVCYSGANALVQSDGRTPSSEVVAKLRAVGALRVSVSENCVSTGRPTTQLVKLQNLTFYPVLAGGPYAVVHFDNGLKSIQDTALRLLRDAGLLASIPFTGLGAIDHVHDSQPTLLQEDVQALQKEGFEFTVHGAYHKDMGRMRPADVFQEARDGINMLGSIGVDEQSLNHFVYPYGSESYSSFLVVRRMFLTARLMGSVRPVQVIRGADLHRMVGLQFDRGNVDPNLRKIDALAEFGSGALHIIFHGIAPEEPQSQAQAQAQASRAADHPKHVTLSQFRRVLEHLQVRGVRVRTTSHLLDAAQCKAAGGAAAQGTGAGVDTDTAERGRMVDDRD